MPSSTTYAAIRANMISLISALTPQFNQLQTFRLTRSETSDFRSYAVDNDASVFREFEIMFIDMIEPGPRDTDVVLTEAQCELVMAYPHHWALYRHDETAATRWNAEAMRAVALQDRRVIIREVGRENTGNLLAGQHASIEGDVTIEDSGDGVSFLVIPFTLTYYEQA